MKGDSIFRALGSGPCVCPQGNAHTTLAAPALAFVLSRLLLLRILARKQSTKEEDKENGSDLPLVGDIVLGTYQSPQPFRRLLGSLLVLTAVILGGIGYGLGSENWDFIPSLYFVISGCQTSRFAGAHHSAPEIRGR